MSLNLLIDSDNAPGRLVERLVEAVRRWEEAKASGQDVSHGETMAHQPQVSLIYSGRNRLYRVTSAEGSFVVKSFGRLSPWRRLYYSYIGTTKARRSHLNALELGRRVEGAAPKSYGYLEGRNALGLIDRCYYVSAYMTATELDIHPHMRGWSAPPDMLRQLGGFIAHLHEAGVEHLDLSPGNILYAYSRETGRYAFALVDLNRMRFCPHALTLTEGTRNINRLPSNPSVTYRLARYYAEARGWDVQAVQRAWHEACDRFWLDRLPKLAYRWGRKRGLGASRGVFTLIYIWYQVLVRLGSISWLRAIGLQAKRKAEGIYLERLRGEDIRHALRRKWGHSPRLKG